MKLLDCTTRDGGYCTNWNYSDEYIYNLMTYLNSEQIDFFEIGYRNYYERESKGEFYYCTPKFLEKFYKRKNNLLLGIMTDIKRFSIKDFSNGNNDCTDFVRIAAHPNEIKELLQTAEVLKEKNYDVMIQLMEVSNLLYEHYKILCEWENKNILETLYIADTYGIMNPTEITKIFSKLKNIGYSSISFHAHNKNGMALQNSLQAIELGAYSIDVSQQKDGRNGGNLLYKDFLKTIK